MINTVQELKELCGNIMEGIGSSGRTVRELFEELETNLQKEETSEESNNAREGAGNGNGDDARGTKTAKAKRVGTPTY